MLRRELQQHTYLGGTAHGDTKYARRQKSAVKKNKQRVWRGQVGENTTDTRRGQVGENTTDTRQRQAGENIPTLPRKSFDGQIRRFREDLNLVPNLNKCRRTPDRCLTCFGNVLLRCFDVFGSQIGSTESGNPVWTYENRCRPIWAPPYGIFIGWQRALRACTAVYAQESATL